MASTDPITNAIIAALTPTSNADQKIMELEQKANDALLNVAKIGFASTGFGAFLSKIPVVSSIFFGIVSATLKVITSKIDDGVFDVITDFVEKKKAGDRIKSADDYASTPSPENEKKMEDAASEGISFLKGRI